MKIKPVHFWLGSLISAVLGALLVLVVVVVASRRTGDDASAVKGGEAMAPAPGRPEPPEPPGLVAISRDDTDSDTLGKEGGHRGGVKGRVKAKPASGAGELETADVAAGIKANIAKLGPCLEAARKHDEIPAGKYTLILDFTILPAGAVRNGQLKGPDYLLKTSLAGCLASKLRTWRFPSSTRGASVKNVPVTVVAN